MKATHISKSPCLVQLGAGLIGRHTGLLVAAGRRATHIRLIDRDVYSKSQAWAQADVGCPKAQALARLMQNVAPALRLEPVVADIEDVALGLLRCDILLTALDSKRARIAANYAFGKLDIPFWIDSGVQAPSLVRVSVFARGRGAPCYECALADADYSADQSYPCQPEFTPPRTNSPEHLGALAAGLQAAECERLLSGQINSAFVNRELVYDVTCHKLYITRLVRRSTCRFDHQALHIRQLRRGPACISVADAFALGADCSRTPRSGSSALLVPGKMFVSVLICRCGERREILKLKGRLGAAEQTCGKCGGRMLPLGTGLREGLVRGALPPRVLARPLSALGFQPSDVLGIGQRGRVTYFELGAQKRGKHD